MRKMILDPYCYSQYCIYTHIRLKNIYFVIQGDETSVTIYKNLTKEYQLK